MVVQRLIMLRTMSMDPSWRDSELINCDKYSATHNWTYTNLDQFSKAMYTLYGQLYARVNCQYNWSFAEYVCFKLSIILCKYLTMCKGLAMGNRNTTGGHHLLLAHAQAPPIINVSNYDQEWRHHIS